MKLILTKYNNDKEIIVDIVPTLKKLFWITIGPIIVAGIFYAGVAYYRGIKTEEEVRELKKNAVTTQVWEATDKKIDRLIISSENLDDRFEKLGEHIIIAGRHTVNDIHKIETKLAVLDTKVKMSYDGVKELEKTFNKHIEDTN